MAIHFSRLPRSKIHTSAKSTNRVTSNTTYDDAGNVTTDNKVRSMGFGYDANGRMVKATKANTPDALSVYDAAGMRVAEKVNDVWRFLIYDIGGKLVTEYGGMQATDDGGVKYLLSDWQGSTRAVVSNSGYVQGRMDFTAFGEEIAGGVGLRTVSQGFGNANNPRQKYGLTTRDEATGTDHTGSANTKTAQVDGLHRTRTKVRCRLEAHKVLIGIPTLRMNQPTSLIRVDYS